jgi:hypothetical protein
MNAFKGRIIPHWSDVDIAVWRTGEGRDMLRAAGLPAAVAPAIIRNASERAGNDHDLFFEVIKQQIADFDKPPEQDNTERIDELAADIQKLPPCVLRMVLDMVIDAYEMMAEGCEGPEIGLYLKRNYPVD